MNEAPASSSRRYDFDWLRVLFGMKPVHKEKLAQKPAVQVS